MRYSVESSSLYQLLLAGKNLQLPKGQVISGFDDPAMLHLIKKGYVKRYLITKEGSKSIQVIYGPNNIFPLTPVYKAAFSMDIYNGPEQYYYEAMTDIEVFSISQAELQKAVRSNPAIYTDLFYAAGLRLNSYIHRLESLSLRAANKKVAHQLVYFANTFGEADDEGVVINVPLTHQAIADVLSLARETVSHIISRFEDKGLIKSGKNIVILDVASLSRIAK